METSIAGVVSFLEDNDSRIKQLMEKPLRARIRKLPISQTKLTRPVRKPRCWSIS